jgi:hypothetical protein
MHEMHSPMRQKQDGSLGDFFWWSCDELGLVIDYLGEDPEMIALLQAPLRDTTYQFMAGWGMPEIELTEEKLKAVFKFLCGVRLLLDLENDHQLNYTLSEKLAPKSFADVLRTICPVAA